MTDRYSTARIAELERQNEELINQVNMLKKDIKGLKELISQLESLLEAYRK